MEERIVPSTASIVANINVFGSSNPVDPTVLNGAVYFAANDGVSGHELWKHDPATGTTSRVADINPGTSSAILMVDFFQEKFTAAGGKLFFAADDGVTGHELWQHDPATGVTSRVIDLNPSGNRLAPWRYSLNADAFRELGGQLYFAGNDGTRFQLWRHDPSTGSTVQLSNFTSSDFGNVFDLKVMDGQLYFVANDGVTGSELWRHDPATGTTSRVADIRPGSASGIGFNGTGLVPFQGRLYFAANDGTTGFELWRHDPATGITARVADIRPGIDSSLASASYGFILTPVGDQLFFRADDGTTGAEIWRHDPSTETTSLVVDLRPGLQGAFPFRHMAAVDGRLYFDADNGVTGRTLWSHDPATGLTTQVAVNGANPTFITGFQGKVLYAGFGSGLSEYDPATGATLFLAQATFGWAPVELSASLYFGADGTGGAELWKYTPNNPPIALPGGPYTVASGGTMQLDGSAVDESLATVTYEWDLDGDGLFGQNGETGRTPMFSAVGKLAGIYPISLRVTDAEGASHTANAIVNVLQPPVGNAGGPYSVQTGDVVQLRGSVSDNAPASVQYEWDLDDNGSFETAGASPLFFTTDKALGFHNIRLRVTDNEGLSHVSSTTVRITQRPVADAGGPYVVVTGQEVVLSGAGSSDNSPTPLIFEWDLDNDGQFDDAVGVAPSFSALDKAAGSYVVSVKVTDDEGLSAIAATSVQVTQPPEADAGGPYTVVEGQAIQLSGAAADNNPASLVFTWDLNGNGIFGEVGEVGTAPTFSAVGLAAGTYVVSLRVTDDEGLIDTVTATVEVITATQYSVSTVESVATQLTTLTTTGILTTTQAGAIQSKLDAALIALEADNSTAAVGQIGAVVNQIRAILNRKSTASDTRLALTALEQELESALALL